MLTIYIPGVVWYDYLDPKATTMQAELGLPDPVFEPYGIGMRVTYVDVRPIIALDLVDYLDERADSLLPGIVGRGRDEQRERDIHRSAKVTAARIRLQLKEAGLHPEMDGIYACVVCGKVLPYPREHVDTCNGSRCFTTLLRRQRKEATS